MTVANTVQETPDANRQPDVGQRISIRLGWHLVVQELRVVVMAWRRAHCDFAFEWSLHFGKEDRRDSRLPNFFALFKLSTLNGVSAEGFKVRRVSFLCGRKCRAELGVSYFLPRNHF
jgi:hypothetical protein